MSRQYPLEPNKKEVRQVGVGYVVVVRGVCEPHIGRCVGERMSSRVRQHDLRFRRPTDGTLIKRTRYITEGVHDTARVASKRYEFRKIPRHRHCLHTKGSRDSFAAPMPLRKDIAVTGDLSNRQARGNLFPRKDIRYRKQSCPLPCSEGVAPSVHAVAMQTKRPPCPRATALGCPLLKRRESRTVPNLNRLVLPVFIPQTHHGTPDRQVVLSCGRPIMARDAGRRESHYRSQPSPSQTSPGRIEPHVGSASLLNELSTHATGRQDFFTCQTDRTPACHRPRPHVFDTTRHKDAQIHDRPVYALRYDRFERNGSCPRS